MLGDVTPVVDRYYLFPQIERVRLSFTRRVVKLSSIGYGYMMDKSAPSLEAKGPNVSRTLDL